MSKFEQVVDAKDFLRDGPKNALCGSGSVVERRLAKANVAGPNPVSRSIVRRVTIVAR